MPQISKTEDEFGKKIDRCITDMGIKSASGLAIGAVLSLLIFKRKAWPIIMGTGFGAGVSYRTCEKDLNM
ncbi:MICOS complex subunit Mic10-like [Haematobia irritans]|uniref:MICOS complex subunit MIC10 n=1 Tax=Haematobia irritans TaxID=7368 RepID=A0A1L8EFD6_HAEIR